MLRLLLFLIFITASAPLGAATCDSGNPEAFVPFFAKFAAEKDFALKRTILPLKSLEWEYGIDANGKGESAPTTTFVSKKQYEKTPPLAEYIKENGLISRIKAQSNRETVVEVFKEGTDWLTSWRFFLRGNCWFLYEYEDHSL